MSKGTAITNIRRNTFTLTLESEITDHYTEFSSLEDGNSDMGNSIKVPLLRFNIEAAIEEARCYDFSNVLRFSDINLATKELVDSLGDILNNNVITNQRSNKYDTPLTPWITRGILNSLRCKRKLHKKMKMHPWNVDLNYKYKTYRNKLTEIINTAKRRYYGNSIQMANGNTKKIWEVINEVRKPNESKVLAGPSSLIVNGGHITDSLEIADYALNAFTTSTSTNTGADVLDQLVRNPNTAFLYPSSFQEISSVIKSLKGDSAVGYDKLPVKLIKGLPNLIPTLLALVNRMLSEAIFPKCLKTGVIKLKHKAGSKALIANYRPLTLLNSLSKVFEKNLKIRIDSFVKKHQLISESQFGFQTQLSTEDALMCIMDKIQCHVAKGGGAMIMSFDIASAFDSVPHKDLLAKLDCKGLRGNFNKLLKSYLEERTVYVNIHGTYSAPGQLTRGLPQGSILGPGLFCLYIDDLHNLASDHKIITSFADDNLSVLLSNNIISDINLFQIWLNRQITWYNENGMAPNYKKCHYMVCGSNHYMCLIQSIQDHIIINNIKLPMEASIRYLGLMIDSKLNWEIQIENVLTKVAYYIPLFYRLREVFEARLLLDILKATLLPTIYYGLILYGSCSKTQIKKLHKFVNRILRIVHRLGYRDNVEGLYVLDGLLNIEQTYALQLCKHVMRIQFGYKNSTSIILERKERQHGGYNLRLGGLTLLEKARCRNRYDTRQLNNRIITTINYMYDLGHEILDKETLKINIKTRNLINLLGEVDCTKLWDRF